MEKAQGTSRRPAIIFGRRGGTGNVKRRGFAAGLTRHLGGDGGSLGRSLGHTQPVAEEIETARYCVGAGFSRRRRLPVRVGTSGAPRGRTRVASLLCGTREHSCFAAGVNRIFPCGVIEEKGVDCGDCSDSRRLRSVFLLFLFRCRSRRERRAPGNRRRRCGRAAARRLARNGHC